MSAAPIGYRPVATLDDTARGAFVVRVYQHLLVAVGAFILFEALLINLGVAEAMWNLLLAARAEGLGGVITTIAMRREDDVKALFDAPDELVVAAVIALGRPVRQPRRLTRAPVADWATVDRVGGEPFGA